MRRNTSPQKVRATQYYKKYERLIYKVVHSYQRTTGEPFEDLLLAGYEGFVAACRNHDPEKGAFSTCAWTYMSNALNDWLNAQMRQQAEETQDVQNSVHYSLAPETSALFQDRVEQLGQEAQKICQVLFALPDDSKPENRTRLKEILRTEGMSWPKIWRGMRELREFCRTEGQENL